MAESVYGPTGPKPGEEHGLKPASPSDVRDYVRIQEEMKQLEQILAVAQKMVQKQLHEAREKGKALSLKTEILAVEGSGEKRGQIGTFNALQGHMATQIQSLGKQVTILTENAPTLEPELGPALDQLSEITTAFPHLSEKQIGELNTLVDKLSHLVNHTSRSTQAAFWEESGKMYKKMLEVNGPLVESYQAQVENPKEKGPALEGLQATLKNLNVVQKGFQGGALGAAAKGGESGSLPSDFSNAIIHHYMPEQQRYLMQLAEILMFNNMGAQMGNALLSIMSNFSSAATSYDLNSILHTDKDGNYDMSPTEARNAIAKAKASAEHDLASIKKALAKIKQQIKDIENNPNLSASQKKELISKLGNLEKSLKIALPQVEKLLKLYKSLNVSDRDKNGHKLPGNKCHITGEKGWAKNLPVLESVVCNGATKEQVEQNPNLHLDEGGGLIPIASDVNAFQQGYADQGQQQQMMLQMRMTEIQQEWTVVSTALQQLNQMYMSMAQGIYK